MTNKNIPIEENKDFGTVNNKRLQKQSVLNIEEKEFWTLVNKHTLSNKKARRLVSTKRQKVTNKENEILDRFECLIRRLAKISTDIPDLVSHVALDILKERKKPKR